METKKSFFKKNVISVKVVTIAVLILLMLIPVGMIKSLISERENNREDVQDEIAAKWGGKQNMRGPILVLPCKRKVVIGEKPYYYYNAYFMPEELKIEGVLNPEERSRGTYEILCYQAKLHINGKFKFPDYSQLNIPADEIEWDKAYFLINISNMQGLKNRIDFKVNNEAQKTLGSITEDPALGYGLKIDYPLNTTTDKEEYNFDFDVTLNGTDGLTFDPIGKQMGVHLKSAWKSVTFVGEFLPNQRNLHSDGFDAEWNIFDYNYSYPQMWLNTSSELGGSPLGLDLLLPVDHYQKTMRSAKYAIMFIALTFLVFFMVELLSKKRIHPIQYLLVSFALVLFYSLLLALSEHLSFGLSYLISAIAIVLLITAYSKSIFKNLKQTIFMGSFLTGLYLFLYVVIQLEDMALLLGSIGLFIALAVVMYVSRKVNWYKEDNSALN